MQEETFQKRYAILQAYYKQNGILSNIKSGDSFVYEGKEINLTSLINNLRAEYKEGTISSEHAKKLESLGMVWKIRNKPAGVRQRFAPLVAYYLEYGDLSRIAIEEVYVFQGEEIKIGALVSSLRRQYLARSRPMKGIRPLTDEEIAILEKMNFKWNQFYKNNQDLIEKAKWYYKLNGSLANIQALDSFVYNEKSINIGKVILSLRKKYANKDNPDYEGKLTDEQIKELEEMGMVWKSNKNDKHRLDPLIDYYNKNGSLKGMVGKNIIYEYKGKQINLGGLANNLRRQYILRDRDVGPRQGRPLTDEEVELLTRMEFPFSPTRTRVGMLIEVLEAYYKENGTITDIDNDNKYFIYEGNQYNLEEVIVNLRKRYRERKTRMGELSPLVDEEVETLEAMGMDWQENTSLQYRDMHRKHFFSKWCKYLTYYYQNYGSLNTIKVTDKMVIEGKVVRIGDIVRTLRSKYRSREDKASRLVPLTDKEVAILESMGMEWSVEHLLIARKMDILRSYYQNYGELNQIKVDDEIEFEGKIIKIGRAVADLRDYYKSYLKDGKHFNPEDIEELNKMGMIWNKQPKRK